MGNHAKRFVTLVNKIRDNIQEIDIETVRVMVDTQQDFFLIDVREESEWLNGHIPSAIHIGKGIIERDIEGIISDQNAEIILYCGGGYRSAIAADSLQKMGYSNVKSMDGGVRRWREAGYKIVSD